MPGPLCEYLYGPKRGECWRSRPDEGRRQSLAVAVPSSEQVFLTARVDAGRHAPRGSIAGRPTGGATLSAARTAPHHGARSTAGGDRVKEIDSPLRKEVQCRPLQER